MQKSLKIYFTLFFIIWILGLVGSLAYPKETFILFVAQHRTPLANEFFKIVTKLGEWYPFVPFFLFLLYKKNKPYLIGFSGLVISALLVANGLKEFFHHERPALFLVYHGNRLDELGSIPNMQFLDGSSSFPSGHTLAAFTLYTAIFLYFQQQKWAFLWLLPAVLVGFSRIYLGHHFLEDVVFGATLGVMLAFSMYYVQQSALFAKYTRG
jgi:membrane-associated phospholipid phosphatase